MCVNAPGWRTWCHALTRAIARVGYDGLWIDNAVLHRCYCRHCQAEAQRMGLILDHPQGSNLAQRIYPRVWLESHLRLWDELRAEGEKYRPGFGIYVNYIEVPYNREVTDHADVCMIEHVWLGITRLLWPGGIRAGYYPAMPDRKVLYNHTQPTTEPRPFENTWAFQLAFAMRGSRGIHWLYGPAAGKEPEFEHNESSALLALAEAAAFGGGCATHVVGQDPFTDEASNQAANSARYHFYKEFVARHRWLYEGLQPAGQVALVVFPNQDSAALLEAQQVHEALRWKGVLCDVVNGEQIDEPTLRRYPHLVLPGQPTVPGWMARLRFIRSPAPVRPEDIKAVTDAYQAGQPIRPLRDTGLATRVLAEIGAQGRLFQPPEGSLVAASAWASPERVVIHLLNYRTPIGRDGATRVEPIERLPLSCPLPVRSRAQQVRAWSPEREEAANLPFEERAGKVRFVLPRLRVYEVCEIVVAH